MHCLDLIEFQLKYVSVNVNFNNQVLTESSILKQDANQVRIRLISQLINSISWIHFFMSLFSALYAFCKNLNEMLLLLAENEQ